MQIKIFVATQKKYWMPNDSVYVPLQVGAEAGNNLGYAQDNIGDNISEKNAHYCELTGLYWAWKNCAQFDAIGLVHYRRYFVSRRFWEILKKKKCSILHRDDYKELLRQYDIILPRKRHYYIETVRSQYEHAHYKRDLDVIEYIIKEKYPQYSNSFDKVMAKRELYLYNMMVMKKYIFDEYCTWLFDVLFMAEKRIDISGYDVYNTRAFGFLGERLFNVWLEKNHQFTRKEVSVLCLEKQNWVKKSTLFVKRKIVGK